MCIWKDLKHLEVIDKEGLILKMHVIHEKYHVITLNQAKDVLDSSRKSLVCSRIWLGLTMLC